MQKIFFLSVFDFRNSLKAVLILLILGILSFCSSDEKPEILKIDPEIKLSTFEKNALLYDIAFQKTGAVLIDRNVSGLIASQHNDAFLWQKENRLVYYNVSENVKKDLEYAPNLLKYELSPGGVSVLFFYKGADSKGKCFLSIEDVENGKSSKKIAMPACKLEGTVLDSSYSYEQLLSFNKGKNKNKSENTKNKLSSIALVLTFKNGITMFNPFVSDWKQTLVTIIPYSQIPSFYSLVPSTNYLLQIPGKEEILVIRGNAGAYKLYRYDILNSKLYRYGFRLKLSYLKLSANLHSALLIKGGAGSERIFKVDLYNKKQKRFKLEKRENPFDDVFGNIYYYQNKKLIMIPVVGKSRELPLFVHAFFPLKNGYYLVETYAGNIFLIRLHFNADIYKRYIAVKSTFPKTVNE